MMNLLATYKPVIKVVKGTNIANVGIELFDVDTEQKRWLAVDHSGSVTVAWFLTEDKLERWLSDCIKSGYVVSVLDGNYDLELKLL